MRSFDDDLLKYKKSEIAKEWLWVPCEDESYRYILGTKGLNPLIVIGINPSLAKANKLDNTMKRVKKIVYNNDFDSYIMLNVYARRKTKINELECELDINLHQENLKAFSYVFETVKKPITIWAAWGIHIYIRDYFKQCLLDIYKFSKNYKVQWKNARLTKYGHPRHPSRLSSDDKFEDFDIEKYLKNL